MAIAEGTLLVALENLANFAVLVIDEGGSQGEEMRNAQREVLFKAQLHQGKVALIEFQQWNGLLSVDPKLKEIVPQHTKIVTKTGLNGFVGTDLEAWLAKFGPSHVVVMGMETNHCVKATVQGGPDMIDGKFITDGGLVGRGYTVISCPQIIHSGTPDWLAHPKVDYYSRL